MFIKVTRFPDKVPMLINTDYIIRIRQASDKSILMMASSDTSKSDSIFIYESMDDIMQEMSYLDIASIRDRREGDRDE